MNAISYTSPILNQVQQLDFCKIEEEIANENPYFPNWLKWVVNQIRVFLGYQDLYILQAEKVHQKSLEVINALGKELKEHSAEVYIHKSCFEEALSFLKIKASDQKLQTAVKGLQDWLKDLNPNWTKYINQLIDSNIALFLGSEMELMRIEASLGNKEALSVLENCAKPQAKYLKDQERLHAKQFQDIEKKKTADNPVVILQAIHTSVLTGLTFERKAEENAYFQLGMYYLTCHLPNLSQATEMFKMACTQTGFENFKAFQQIFRPAGMKSDTFDTWLENLKNQMEELTLTNQNNRQTLAIALEKRIRLLQS